MSRAPHYILVGITAAAIAYYAVAFTGRLPDHRWVRGWNDIVLHLGAFALLALVTLPLFRTLVVPVAVLSGFAAALEIAQMGLPHRSASVGDLAANLAGIFLGLLLVRAARMLAADGPSR